MMKNDNGARHKRKEVRRRKKDDDDTGTEAVSYALYEIVRRMELEKGENRKRPSPAHVGIT